MKMHNLHKYKYFELFNSLYLKNACSRLYAVFFESMHILANLVIEFICCELTQNHSPTIERFILCYISGHDTATT